MHQLRIPASRPSTAPEIVDYLIAMALKIGASDIHVAVNQHPSAVEPYLLRFRVFGKLQVSRSEFLVGQYREVIARIKVLAGMNSSDSTLPQDGQIQVEMPGSPPIVLRVATIPGHELEDVTIRLQRSSNTKHTLDTLIIPEDLRLQLKQLVKQESGMIVLNGPAGSGKTTTIYSMIGSLADPERKIVTAEDPIETRLNYVNHVQVTPKTSFAVLCRSFMRQDADVIFVGEIRDPESAEAAIQLAQTGHLVLTTLHTRDSIGVVSRLEALGVHSNLIATTLIGSLCQRLVPLLCTKCRVPGIPEPALLRRLEFYGPIPQGARFAKTGPGCPSCVNGVQGQLAIFELFMIDPEVAELINRGAHKAELAAFAKTKGMRNLAKDALQRVYEGVIDLNSVISFVIGPEYSKASAPAAPPRPSLSQGEKTAPMVQPAFPRKKLA